MSAPFDPPRGGDILIVDDSPMNLRLLLSLLEEHHYSARGVRSGRMALMAAQCSPPDLILLDITMPQMDGYEVCSRLKANPSTQDIPIIFISGLHQVMDKVQAFEAGGVDYILKPFQSEEVLARIDLQLTLQRLQRQLRRQNEHLQREIDERKQVEAALQRANQELERLAFLDGLTQVSNRRRFDRYLEEEWQMGRDRHPLSLILMDVDEFKRYNDTYGHLAGDECLIRVAQAIASSVRRSTDLVARYGGEEFAAILPNTSPSGTLLVAKTIQEQVHKLNIPHGRSSASDRVSLSFGLASMVPRADKSPETLIEQADIAVYEAKRQGRNRIVQSPVEANSVNSSLLTVE